MDEQDVSDSRAALAETFGRNLNADGVCVADGYGLVVKVDRGHLVVGDGIGSHRRQRTFVRASRDLRRLVILGHSGFVTLEALRWCSQVGVAVVALDGDGAVLYTSGATTLDDARLRRAQVLAAGNDVGLTIVRHLLDLKLLRQAENAVRFFDARAVADTIESLRVTLDDAPTVGACRQVEAASAAAYFSAWTAHPAAAVRFATTDARRVPSHWLAPYRGRRSPLAGGTANRKAAVPTNAILNYLYAVAEAECRMAAAAVGLDPGLGVLHLDARDRDSMALDLIEPVRPVVERAVLRILAERTFRRIDFGEVSDGTCRVLSPLSHVLAETALEWKAVVAPAAEAVVRMLVEPSGRRASTPLTGDARRRMPRVQVPLTLPGLAPTCRHCGAELVRRKGRLPTYCAPCWPKVRADLARQASAASAGVPRPPLTPEVAARRSVAISMAATRRRERLIAADAPGWSMATFSELIVPGLAAIDLGDIMAATGLSRSSASLIRSGQRTPRPQHWPTLARLAGVSADVITD